MKRAARPHAYFPVHLTSSILQEKQERPEIRSSGAEMFSLTSEIYYMHTELCKNVFNHLSLRQLDRDSGCGAVLPYLLYSEFRESPETTQVSGRVSWEVVCLLLIQVRFKLFLSVLRPPGLKVQKQKSSAIPALPLKWYARDFTTPFKTVGFLQTEVFEAPHWSEKYHHKWFLVRKCTAVWILALEEWSLEESEPIPGIISGPGSAYFDGSVRLKLGQTTCWPHFARVFLMTAPKPNNIHRQHMHASYIISNLCYDKDPVRCKRFHFLYNLSVQVYVCPLFTSFNNHQCHLWVTLILSCLWEGCKSPSSILKALFWLSLHSLRRLSLLSPLSALLSSGCHCDLNVNTEEVERDGRLTWWGGHILFEDVPPRQSVISHLSFR